MSVVFEKPKALTDAVLHYCPGCTHGIIHRLVAEVIDELGIEGKTIGVAPVGCAVMAYDYFTCDFVQAAHGRAPAVATGVKRSDPSKIVFTYQGDGDLAAIGTAETVHSAARRENITVIFRPHPTAVMLRQSAILLRFLSFFQMLTAQLTSSVLLLTMSRMSRMQRRLSRRLSRTRSRARASLLLRLFQPVRQTGV